MARLILRGGNLAWAGIPRGGHATYVLQWLYGLQRLGHDVLYHDVLEGQSLELEAFRRLTNQWWDPRRSAAFSSTGQVIHGLSMLEVEAFAEGAAGLISLGAPYAADPEPWLAHVRPRVVVDQDPAFTQLWALESDPELVYGVQDFYFTVGANVGKQRSAIPTCGIDWRHTRNPVVLDWWSGAKPSPDGRFTTVASLWSQKYQEFEGEVWGPKAVELERFIELPKLCGESLEIALEAGTGVEMLSRLHAHGWLTADAEEAARSPETYQAYIAASSGEFTCVKGLYVGTNSGWFSDRSAAYLAAGKPVVTQDTGLCDVLPCTTGLHFVRSVEEAAEAISRIRANYLEECEAARSIAAAYFDSDEVLSGLLDIIGVV
jgi:hypothetical protein